MLRPSMLAITLVSVTLQAHAFGLGLSGGVGNIFGELATRSGTQTSGDSIDEVLQQLSLELNKKMPINVDAVTAAHLMVQSRLLRLASTVHSAATD